MLKAILGTLLFFTSLGAQQTDTTRQYRIDTNHSTIGFTVSIMGGLSKVTGKFTDFNITLLPDQKDIRKAS